MAEEWRGAPVGGGPPETPVTVPGKPGAFAGADGVTYETSFVDPRTSTDEIAVLALNGLYAHAEIDLSGDRLDGEGPIEHDAYFEPVRVPFRPDGVTTVSVTCQAPRDRFGGLYDTDRVPATERVPGVWWDATVETRHLPCIDSLRVHPELTDGGARLHVRTAVVSGGPIDERITYSLKPEGDLQTPGTMNREPVAADGEGVTTVEHTIEVRDPALWWPRNLGAQNRYTLQARLGDSERSVTTGVCEVQREGDHLVVNGEALPVRGVALLTDDPADVERAVDLHANLVRAPAHVLSPAVYDACDEAGLLVWQGLPLTGPGTFDVDRGRSLARRLVDTYGHHPSLAAIGVHDEPTDAFADGLGTGVLDRLRLRWRAWRASYDRGPAERVGAAVAEDCPVVPVVGGPGVDHDAAAYYPGWDYGTAGDVDALLARYPTDLLAAFGAGALAADGRSKQDATDRAPAGFDAGKHAAHVDGGPEASQAYQAEVLRTVTEAARRRGLGLVASALRDAGAAGRGVYAADGTPKAARDALAAALQPVQAFLTEPSPGPSEVVVVNDVPESVSATLSWTAGDETGKRELTVPAADRWTGDVDVPAGETVRLAVTVGDAAVENVYDI